MRELLKTSKGLLTRKQSHILSAAVAIMFTFALSHIMGLVKTRLLISYFFGNLASHLDVYYAAYALPDTVFQLLVIGSLSAAFIPVFTKHLAQNESSAWKVASATMSLVIGIFVIISAVIFITAPMLAPIIAPGFSAEQLSLLVLLLRIMLGAQFFFSISGFLTAIIQSHQRFIVPALAPLAYNIGIILGIVLLSPTLGILGPAIGAVIGAAFHMLIQLPVAIQLGFRPRLNFSLSQPGVKDIVRLMPPRALALGIDQIEQLVAVIIASTLAAGSLSILNVARLLYMIPASLFGVTIGQAALPALSREINEGREKFVDMFISSLLQVVYLALPISVLFIVLRIPVVRIVFGASSFPWSATILTGWTVAILTLAATTSAAMQLISRGFYALHDTKTPLIVGLTSAVIGVVASIVATQALGWGVLGLAGSIAFTNIFETILLLIIICRRIKISIEKIFPPIVKMLVTSSVMGISLYIPMKLLDQFVFDTTRTIPLLALTGITTAIGMAMYLMLSYFFRVDEFYTFFALAKKLSNIKSLLSLSKSTPVSVPPTDQN